MPTLTVAGARYDCPAGETVLDALTRQGLAVPSSCRKGICCTCMMRASAGDVPKAAQQGLKDSLVSRSYFLACQCMPEGDLTLESADDVAVYAGATVVGLEQRAPDVMRVLLRTDAPFAYRAGQFVNLRREDGMIRSYSLASVPGLDPAMELHVKRLPDGAVSGWIFDSLRRGGRTEIQGPNGTCFYVPEEPQRKLLLIGNGTGLAPLYGIARDALRGGHREEIHLYHGSRSPQGLYLDRELRLLAAAHPNFSYHPCVSGLEAARDHRPARADAAAFSDVSDLSNWRVYVCGLPDMVKAAKKRAYLAGAALADIYADPFETRSPA